MINFEDLNHPAVELKLPLDGGSYERVIPKETTLFFWGALAPGTASRIPQRQSKQGARLFNTVLAEQDQISISVSIDGESVPLLTDSFLRQNGYEGLAWWIAIDSVPLPASVSVVVEISGPQPSDQDEPLVLWTEHGEPIEWGETRTSTMELRPADIPATSFASKQECLWGRNEVYIPK